MFGLAEVLLVLATSYLVAGNPACLTEDITCTMAGNVLDTVAGVLTKEECNTLCVGNDECHFFNWYGPTGVPFKNICFLLDSCSSTSSCTGCVSGGEDICALQSSECSIRGSCNVEEDNLITLEPCNLITIKLYDFQTLNLTAYSRAAPYFPAPVSLNKAGINPKRTVKCIALQPCF